MRFIAYSDKLLLRLSHLGFTWYPYAGFRLKNDKLLLVDCGISSIMKDLNIRILLSRVIPSNMVVESEKPPLSLGILSHEDCNERVLSDLLKNRETRSATTSSVKVDTIDYLAVRMLGVPSALRRLEEAFKEYARETLHPSRLIEGLNMQNLDYLGVIFQLLAIDKRKGEVYFLEGEKYIRARFAERIIRENSNLQAFLLANLKPPTK
ncbi:MAG: hypothetical protein ABWK01_08735 [Infirmifilum sp.]